MELRTASSPRDVKHYTTERLREEFLIQGLFPADEIKLVYSHIDRIITGRSWSLRQETSFVRNISCREESWALSISAAQEELPLTAEFMKWLPEKACT